MTNRRMQGLLEWLDGERLVASGHRAATIENHLKNALEVDKILNERPPSGEVGYEEYHDGVIGVFKMNADGSRNLKVLTPQASEQFRAMLQAAEAEVRKPCPLCGRTDPHSHTSVPLGMS